MVYPSYLTTHITPFDIAQSRHANHPLIVQEQQRNYFTKIKNKKKKLRMKLRRRAQKVTATTRATVKVVRQYSSPALH